MVPTTKFQTIERVYEVGRWDLKSRRIISVPVNWASVLRTVKIISGKFGTACAQRVAAWLECLRIIEDALTKGAQELGVDRRLGE